MRILHIEYATGFGGSLTGLAELIASYRDNSGIELTVVSFAPEDMLNRLFPDTPVIRLDASKSISSRLSADRLASWIRSIPFLGRHLARGVAFIGMADDYFLKRNFVRIARECRADLIHLNNGIELSGIWAARELGVGCVVHHRGPVPKGMYNTVRRASGWMQDAVRWQIGMSELVSRSIIESGIPESHVVTIYDPMDADAFQCTPERRDEVREQWGIGSDDVVVGVLARVIPWKGQLEFLQGMRSVVPDCAKMKIMITGDAASTDNRYFEQVRQIAEEPPLRGRVVLTGFQSDISDYYGASDIIVHCSRDPEPFGRISLEAWASGTALIAMDEGGPPEVVTHEVDGLLVPPRDEGAMNSAVHRLYSDEELRAQFVEAGFKTVRGDFSPRTIASQVIECFEQAVGSPLD